MPKLPHTHKHRRTNETNRNNVRPYFVDFYLGKFCENIMTSCISVCSMFMPIEWVLLGWKLFYLLYCSVVCAACTRALALRTHQQVAPFSSHFFSVQPTSTVGSSSFCDAKVSARGRSHTRAFVHLNFFASQFSICCASIVVVVVVVVAYRFFINFIFTGLHGLFILACKMNARRPYTFVHDEFGKQQQQQREAVHGNARGHISGWIKYFHFLLLRFRQCANWKYVR